MTDKPAEQSPVNTAQAIRDVLIAALERGQFIPALLGLVLLVFFISSLYFLEPADRARLIFTVVHPGSFWAWAGYGLAGILALLWYFERQRYRQTKDKEIARLAEERNYWQEVAFMVKAKFEEATIGGQDKGANHVLSPAGSGPRPLSTNDPPQMVTLPQAPNEE